MIDVVATDLDSTLCDLSFRPVPGALVDGTPDWLEYSLHCDKDLPFEGIATALRMVSASYPVLGISMRHQEAEEKTRAWFDLHDIPLEFLKLFNSEVDVNDPYHCKTKFLSEVYPDVFNIVLLFEDNYRIAKFARDLGIPVVCVEPLYRGSDLRESFLRLYSKEPEYMI